MIELKSPAFTHNGFIPNRFSMRGGNVSPPLHIACSQPKVKTYAIICHDPDAPGPNGFTHWLLWNIPRSATVIAEGQTPTGSVAGMTDWGTTGWGGPQPPSGTHRYNFYAYALDSELSLPATTKRNDLLRAMNGHIIDSAILTGYYGVNSS